MAIRLHRRTAARALGAWRGFLNAHALITRRISRELADAGLPDLSCYDLLRRMWPVYARGIDAYFAAHLARSAPRVRAVLERMADSAREPAG